MKSKTPCHIEDPRDVACEYCRSAIDFLDKHSIAPTPSNFAVAYEYSSDRNSKLTTEIDSKLMNTGVVDGYLFMDLFDRFFIKDDSEEIDGYISNLCKLFQQAMDGVHGASTGVTEFGDVLKSQKNKLVENPGLEGIQGIVSTLIEATEQAHAANEQLRTHLEETEKKTSMMRDELTKLQKEAVTDGLTGLYNRKALNNRLEELLEKGSDSGEPFSVLMLDIDHFKSINDGFGHQIGDEVIRRVAKAVEEYADGEGFAARYGGEEFALVLPQTDVNKAVEIGRTISEAVKKLVLIRRKSKERLPPVSISGGVASYKSGEKQEDLLDRADRALYFAKNNGRDQIVSDMQLVAAMA